MTTVKVLMVLAAGAAMVYAPQYSKVKPLKDGEPVIGYKYAQEKALDAWTSLVTASREVKAENVKVSTISVSSLKVEWDAEEDREYTVECFPVYGETGYVENIVTKTVEDGKAYVTGLREGSRYNVIVTPVPLEEDEPVVPTTVEGETETVEVIWEDYEYIDGWTNCFCGERASGLTRNPSWSAIQGSSVDVVTNTGIMRNAYGDYCVAMGVYYGYCNDRFLIELENGVQFTVKICDSKGLADDADGDGVPDGKFHWYGGTGNGKCIVEFIYDESSLPYCVRRSGSWGYYYWDGLNLGSNIRSIKKINYGEPIEY